MSAIQQLQKKMQSQGFAVNNSNPTTQPQQSFASKLKPPTALGNRFGSNGNIFQNTSGNAGVKKAPLLQQPQQFGLNKSVIAVSKPLPSQEGEMKAVNVKLSHMMMNPIDQITAEQEAKAKARELARALAPKQENDDDILKETMNKFQAKIHSAY